jgi:hypothetical protein
MKKIYTLLFALISITGVLKAQLTLTKAANEPIIGDITTELGFDSVGVIPKTTGAAQTWNFSALTQNTVVAVSTYTTVSSTPSAVSFPLATIAQLDDGGNYTYFQSTPSTYELNGFAGAQFAATFTNNAIAAQWPINYLYSNTDTYSGTIGSGTMTGAANGTITTTAPGNGVVLLPGSQTFSNCLQVKAVNSLKATIPVPVIGNLTVTIVSTDYSYYNSAQKYPILTVSYSKQTLTSILGPTVTATASTRINQAVYAGINVYTLDNTLSIYPNPANGIFHVMFTNEKNEKLSLEIINNLGQNIKTIELGNDNDINTAVDVSTLQTGVYYVKTTLGKNSVVKKLVIQ